MAWKRARIKDKNPLKGVKQHQKRLRRVLSSKYHRWEFSVQNLDETEIPRKFGDNFLDEVGTPKKGVENREKREFLKDLITRGKKLPGKKPWTVELIDQASNEEVEKLHSKYTQKELQHKGEKTGKAMGKHLIKLYSNGVSKVLRIDDMEQLRKY